MKPSQSGFTLIELVIVIAVLGIIMAVAVPSFTEQVAKSRRSDAVSAVGRLQLALESWRAECPTYASNATCLDPDGDGTDNRTYPVAAATDFYTFTLSGQTAAGYTLTAQPSGKQTGDRCGNLVFTYANGASTKTSSTGASNCGF